MKPDTATAMRDMIGRIRAAVPFSLPPEKVCDGNCKGCSIKLIAYLDTELLGWEQRLDDGELPDFKALSQLRRTAVRVHRVLERNGLVDPLD